MTMHEEKNAKQMYIFDGSKEELMAKHKSKYSWNHYRFLTKKNSIAIVLKFILKREILILITYKKIMERQRVLERVLL